VGVSRDRVLYKFVEKRFGKLERVFEIFVENQGTVATTHSEMVDINAEEYIRLIRE
jgi:hypothetical protein